MFISAIGSIASFIGAVLAFITYRKTAQDGVILAHNYLKILNDDMKGLVEFICDSIEICKTGIGIDDYQSFMRKTRSLNSYLSYFIYKKEHSILNGLKLPSKYKKLIEKKQKVVIEIRDKIFQLRKKYRNATINATTNNIISITDLQDFRNVYSEIRKIINEYQYSLA